MWPPGDADARAARLWRTRWIAAGLFWWAWVAVWLPEHAAAAATEQLSVKICAGFSTAGFPDDCCTDQAVGLAFGKLAWERLHTGLGGPPVNISYEYEDTTVDPGRAITCAFTGWQQEKVWLIMGAGWSSVSLPLAQLGATLGGTLLDFGGTADALSSPSYPTYVRTCVPDGALAAGMAQLLMLPSLYNYSRLAVLYESDEYGAGLQTRLLQEVQRIRPSAYVKQVPLLAVTAGDLPGSRERLRSLRGSACRVIVTLCQQSATWEIFVEAEFKRYVTGPSFFLFGPEDAGNVVGQLSLATRQQLAGLQVISRGASSGGSFQAGWEQLWLNMRLEDLPEPVSTWASCLGGPLSADPDCWWGGAAMFQNTDFLSGTYFGWAFDASWLLHTTAHDLLARGVTADAMQGGLLADALVNTSATDVGVDGPLTLTADGDRVVNSYMLVFFDADGTKVPFGNYETASQAFIISRPPVFADGSTVRPADTFPPCPRGYFRDDTVCEPAPPGSFSPQGTLTEPIPCPAGSASASPGLAQCALCDAGSFVGAPGATACSGCQPGKFADKAGQSVCMPCMLGYSANQTGQSECAVCPRGSYAGAVGSTDCAACPALTSTENVGSRSLAQCECLEGYFRDGDNCSAPPKGVVCPFASRGLAECRCDVGHYGVLGRCQACTQGMLCDAVGLEAPEQSAGFDVELAGGDIAAGTARFSVYACYDDLQCPSGRAGGCASGRLGLACGRCQDGHYPSSGGACTKCKPADRAPMIVLGAVCLVLVFPLYWYACPDVTRRSMNVLTVTNVAGQIIFVVQALGVFAGLRVRWVQPITNMMKALKLVQLDFDVLKLQCLIGADSGVTHFVGEMLIFPAFAVYLAVVAALFHTTKWRTFTWKRYFNVAGLVALVLHMPLTLAVLRPFYCVANPNGTRHVVLHPDVLCWESPEHRVFVAVAVLGIIAYPAVNIAMVTGITWRYTALLNTDSGLKSLDNYQFLFDRFAPQRYYYALAFFWRGMLLPIIPVVLPDSGVAQVTAVRCLLLVCLCILIRLQPWASPLGNVTETVLLLGTICVVDIAGFLVEMASGSSWELAVVMMLIIGGVVAFAVAVILVCVHRWLARTDQYAVFLCHHKLGAGVLARFFKMRLREFTSRPVFLDSDDLQELAALFDIVRTRTRTLVALMTKHTQERMWCAGELTTTVRNSIPLVLLACEDYVPLGEEEIASFGQHWSPEQRATLATAGMPLEAIRDAYRHVAAMGVVRLNRFGAREEHGEAVKAVAERCGLLYKSMEAMSSWATTIGGGPADAGSSTTDLIVAACHAQAEARCVAYILSEQLRVALRSRVRPAFSAEEVEPMSKSAKCMLVVLTTGLFEGAKFVELLLSVPQEIDIVTALADPSFQFPAEHFLGELEKLHGAEALFRIKRVVNSLAVPYSALGSEALLNTQVSQLLLRLKLRGQSDGVELRGQGDMGELRGHNDGGAAMSKTPSTESPVAKAGAKVQPQHQRQHQQEAAPVLARLAAPREEEEDEEAAPEVVWPAPLMPSISAAPFERVAV